MTETTAITNVPDTPPRLALRSKEAAKALGISERKLWTLTHEGVVPHVRIGTAILYPVDVLRRWLDQACAPIDKHPVATERGAMNNKEI